MDSRHAPHPGPGDADSRAFVEEAYALLLRRPPDPDATERALAGFRDGTLSRAALLAELGASAEFSRVRELDDAVARARHARAGGVRLRELRAASGDERPIEIPWVLSRLAGAAAVLDVGTANAEPAYVAGLVTAGIPRLVGLDLAPFSVDGLASVVGDLRALPFPDGGFDAVACISTLEHVGLDNAVYGGPTELDETGMERALGEIRRVLAPAGSLLVSVPAGVTENHGWFVQQPPAAWLDLFRRAGFRVHEHEVYEQSATGWASAADDAVNGLRYGERGPGAAAVLCADLRPATLAGSLRAQAGAVRNALRRPR